METLPNMVKMESRKIVLKKSKFFLLFIFVIFLFICLFRRHRSRERRRSKDRDREKRRRSHSREREKRRRSRSKERERRRHRSRSPSRKHRSSRRSKSRERLRTRSRSPDRFNRRSPLHERPRHRSPSPIKEELPIEERDQRTVFCMQLAARVRQRDIEEFFTQVGKVREVRLIMDNRTRRHKGIAYVEFLNIDSVGKAIALTGTRLCGVPIVVQHSQAEKNRLANANALSKMNSIARNGLTGPMSLYVGSLHFNITEDMLRSIFEPFGKVDKIELSRDPETNRSKGYGFIHFREAEDAKKALEQMNGFELAGRPMKVNYITERSEYVPHGPGALDCDEMDRTGIDLGATGRLQLMAKLAEGTGIELPQAAVNALHFSSATSATTIQNGSQPSIPIATQCFLLTNMFDPSAESNPNWPDEIKNDVIEECRKHGGVVHVYVDRDSSEGYVYVKCASISSATATVNALHGRWFAGI